MRIRNLAVAVAAGVLTLVGTYPTQAHAATTEVRDAAALAAAFAAAVGHEDVVVIGADFTSTPADPPVAVPQNTTVTLNLNSHHLNVTGAGDHAGLEVQGTAGLVVIDPTGGGRLTAIGGPSGAGIGGSASGDAGHITIAGGTVSATGGAAGGAGIGSAVGRGGGPVIITGGNITARGGGDEQSSTGGAAGIGAGQGGTSVPVQISDGTINAFGSATAEFGGPGIGGGTNTGPVTIDGGRVTATGAGGAAGIGGARSGSQGYPGAALTIGQGAVVLPHTDGGNPIGGGTLEAEFGSVHILGFVRINGSDTWTIPEGVTVRLSGGSLDNYGNVVNDGAIIVDQGMVYNPSGVTGNHFNLNFLPMSNRYPPMFAPTLADAEVSPPDPGQQPGLVFAGWNTAADGSGNWVTNTTSLRDLLGAGPQGLNLYAQWSLTPVPTVTATVTEPGPTVTATVSEPGPTVTATATTTATATATVTEPGPTVTATATATSTATVTAPGPTTTATITEPGPTTTATITEPAPTRTATATVTEPGPTSTATVTVPAPTTDPSAPTVDSPYTSPGFHNVNGRSWNTTCEPYSQTTRCRTEIWGTTVGLTPGGEFVQKNGWVFNNLTYLPSPRSLWVGNPLGSAGEWTAGDGREWRTECDTPRTGGNGCRSYARATFFGIKDGAFTQQKDWVFNNIVLFG